MNQMGWRRLIFVCFCLLQIVFCYPLYASPSVSVTAKQRIVTVQQRGIVTLPFTVTNRGTKTLILDEKVDLPTDWRILAKRGSFTLAPGESILRLVHVLASSNIPAGKHTIPYHVISRDTLAIHAEEKINVVIHSTSKLLISTLEKPELVLSGEEYSIKVRAENKGNSALSLTVSVKDTLGYLVSFEPRHLQLAPSSSQVITLKSSIPANLKKSLSHTLKLSLRGSISEDKNISTQVISRIPMGTGLYHRLPTTISSNYIDDGRNSALQTELIARGSLDEQGEHYIDLLYRDEWSDTSTSFSGHSEQHITYQHKALSLHLGDRTFPVAGITNNGFYGRGYEASYHPSNQNWSARAFSVEQRPENNDSGSDTTAEMQGFEIGYQHSDNLELAFNIISKETDRNSQKNERLSGFELYWDKYAEAEINFSMAHDKDGGAFKFEQNGTLGALSYDIEVERAGTAFDGRISDIERQRFTGIYHVNNKKNYLRTSLFHSKANLDKDNTQRIPEEKRINVGFGHYFGNNIQDSLYTELFIKEAKDRRSESDLNYSEQGIRVDYNKSIHQTLGLNAVVEYAQKNDNINDQKSDQTRGGLTLAYTPSEKYYFGFNIDSLQRNNESGYNTGEQLSYGLNASVRFNAKQRLSGYWRRSENSDSNNQNLHVNYSHTFQNGMTLGASISTDLKQDEMNDLSYLLKISAPFDAPLYRYKNIATVSGKITDYASRQPIANLVIGIAGQYAVTDKNGYYQFKAIRAGKYSVTTDLSRTNFTNYFLEDAKYQAVALVANQATVHNIVLAQGTGVSGQVLNHAMHHSPAAKSGVVGQDGSDLQATNGIGGLLITLTHHADNTQTYKILTNEGGYFYFNGIKAGQWKIQASDPEGVIKESRLEKAQRTINLEMGEDKKITFKVIPLIKKIKKIGPSIGFSVMGE